MNETEALQLVLRAFAELGIPHAITGSLASNAYGDIRSTKDADIVVAVEPEQLAPLFGALEQDFEIDRQMRLENITSTARFVLKHRRSRFIIELFLLTDEPFDRSRFARRVAETYLDQPTFFMSPEDVIVQKALWLHRSDNPKHRLDLLGILRVQMERLDWEYIWYWADHQGTRSLLEKLREMAQQDRPPTGQGRF